MNNAPVIEKMIQQVIKLRDDRDWEQFHNLKDLAIGLNIESSELLELFLWKSQNEIDEFIKDKKNLNRIKEELADILIFCLLVANKIDANVEEIVYSKLQKNAQKYPVDKSKGKACKYTELDQTCT